jgi:hypothetical protein
MRSELMKKLPMDRNAFAPLELEEMLRSGDRKRTVTPSRKWKAGRRGRNAGEEQK